jgi:hypothetical protein
MKAGSVSAGYYNPISRIIDPMTIPERGEYAEIIPRKIYPALALISIAVKVRFGLRIE